MIFRPIQDLRVQDMSLQKSIPTSKAIIGARDIHWIRGALQSAIAIEHSTMPLYAAAMYSLEVQNYPAYNTLRAVLMGEMLHMSAMCNILAALGGVPRIKQLNPTAITGGFPGSVMPGLTARIAKLSREQLSIFMRIESPEEILPIKEKVESRYPTIGRFYVEIQRAMKENAASVRAAILGRRLSNQVGGNLGYAIIDPKAGDPVEQIIESIELVINQGEGFDSTISSGLNSQEELSHYARFAELRFGRSYTGPSDPNNVDINTESQRRYFQGDRIVWPNVINFLAVPKDGYAAILHLDPNKQDVLKELQAFDVAYTRMLAALDDAWNGSEEDSWPSLGRAVFEMNELRVTSCFNILRHQIPAEAISQIDILYPLEAEELRRLSDFSQPLFYGPRFINTSLTYRTPRA
jgi:hypothetical protein